MTVRSSHLAGPFNLASGTNEVLLAPDGHHYVIRSFWIHNDSGSARTVGIMLNDDSTTKRMWRAAIAAGDNVIIDSWWVLNPGDEILVNTTGTGPIVTVFGADLVDPD